MRRGKEEIFKILEKVKHTSGVVFASPQLEYLKKGGQINYIQYLIASTINYIPITEIKNGPITFVERIKQRKRLIPRLLELVANRVEKEIPIRIAVVHADGESQAWELSKKVEKRFSPDESIISELTTVLGIHAGPDAIGLAYSFGY